MKMLVFPFSSQATQRLGTTVMSFITLLFTSSSSLSSSSKPSSSASPAPVPDSAVSPMGRNMLSGSDSSGAAGAAVAASGTGAAAAGSAAGAAAPSEAMDASRQ